MRRLIWLPVAGFLLVAGAAIAAAAAAPTLAPAAANLNAASPAPTAAASPATNDNQPWGPGFGHMEFDGAGTNLLNQVLSDLVKAGTITQAQSDAITGALQTAITDQQTQAEQQRQQMQQQWTQIQGFLQDGVITQDEVNQLPADSPFRQVFDSIAQDGKVTLQQLQQLGGFGMGPGMMNHGRGFGPGMGPMGPWSGNPNNPNPQSTPSMGTGSSS
jgi:polyhydroxyalkanoate synthesis regulator phasin